MSECPITLRVLKGSALTHAELDNNFVSLRNCISNLQTQVDTIGSISGETTPYIFMSGSTESIVPNTSGGNTMRTVKPYSSILAGSSNVITNASKSVIGGGSNNSLTAENLDEITSSFIGSGVYNTLFANRSVIISGLYNEISGLITFKGDPIPSYSVLIGSGSYNRLTSSYNSSILGGARNKMYDSSYSSILGGYGNFLSDGLSTEIIGGYKNRISGGNWTNTIVGGYNNVITNRFGNFIGAGGYNSITGGTSFGTHSQYSSILGGSNNKIDKSKYSSIIGGYNNKVYHVNSHVIGSNITTISANTTYVESLNIKTISTGSTSSEVLVRETNGTINTKQIETLQQTIVYITSTGTTYSDGRSPVASGILNMGLTPIELLPAAGVGKYYDIEKIIFEYTYNSIAYTVSDSSLIIFTYNQPDTYIGVVNKKIITSSETLQSVVVLGTNPRGTNESILFTTYPSNTDPTNGNGTLRAIITYTIRTFGS